MVFLSQSTGLSTALTRRAAAATRPLRGGNVGCRDADRTQSREKRGTANALDKAEHPTVS